MNKKHILAVVILFIIVASLISFIFYAIANDPMNDLYRDRIEYPLRSVETSDNSQYMLVKWQHSPVEAYEIITDTQIIKENVSAFCVDNDGSIYATTPDGLIYLYENGKLIDSVPFDGTYTKKIEYGTLEFQKVNQMQYQLLLGYSVVEQDENYTILCDAASAEPYYYCFAHGKDLESVDKVYLLDSDDSIDNIPKPKKISESILEYIEYSSNYAGNQTRHWYFNLSDCKLSDWYWNVKDIKENLLVRPACYMDGGKSRIIIHDMFDKEIDYKEIYGDFPEPRDDHFLLAAKFLENGILSAEYIGNDHQVHKSTFII